MDINKLCVDSETIKDILSRQKDVTALRDAFLWDCTEQGHEHWQRIYDGESEMTWGDVKYLNDMMNAYNAQKQEQEKGNSMYVLVAVNTDFLPILIQADSLESLNEKIEYEYGDWEEFSYRYNEEFCHSPEDTFSLWKLENGTLVHKSFTIRTRPIIVI